MISVAMCTYNGEKYIQEQLESIINQSMPPDEIVICDDCSKDTTLKIVKDTLKSYDGIVQLVSNKHNLGYRKNFEKAISLCHGDIIFLSDQDDVWNRDKIEIIKTEIEKDKNILLTFHDVEIVDENLYLISNSFWDVLHFDYMRFLENDFRRLMESNVIQGSSCAFRRELFTYAIPFPECAVHDEWLGLIAHLKGKVKPVNLILAKYRQSGNNAIGAGKISLREKINKWLLNINKSTDFYVRELKRRRLILSYLIDIYKESNNIYTIKQYYAFLNKRINYVNNKKIYKIIIDVDYFNMIGKNVRAIKIIMKDIFSALIYKKYIN